MIDAMGRINFPQEFLQNANHRLNQIPKDGSHVATLQSVILHLLNSVYFSSKTSKNLMI